MNPIFDLEISDEKLAVAARSEVYKILSAIFVYPGTVASKQFLLCDAIERLRQAAKALPYALPAIENLGPLSDDEQEIEVTYASLFENCKGRPTLSLHEKDYLKDDPQKVWEELIRFYEHFGLNYDLRLAKEWPDWIGTELEFLHYLTFLEVGASKSLANGYIAAEADFLEKHLVRWIPRFAELLSKAAMSGPYGVYANVLAQFIEADANHSRTRKPVH